MFCYFQFHSYLCHYSSEANSHLKFAVHVVSVSGNILGVSDLRFSPTGTFQGDQETMIISFLFVSLSFFSFLVEV